MRRDARALLVVAVVVGLAALAVAGGLRRWSNAQAGLRQAMTVLAETQHRAVEIAALRATQERVGLRERPRQDVIALVNAVLAEAGIPNQRLTNLEPEADVALSPRQAKGHPAIRRQSFALSLDRLSVRELGAFLSVWRAAQKVWAVARIELGHLRETEGEEGLYSVRLLIRALYVGERREES